MTTGDMSIAFLGLYANNPDDFVEYSGLFTKKKM
jgi:hypothetical protein